MQAGNDDFTADFVAPNFFVNDNCRILLAAHGGAGNDTLNVNYVGATLATLEATALLDIELDGGSGNDVIGFLFPTADTLDLDGRLLLHLSGGGGNDALTVTLDLQGTSTGFYDWFISGGSGNDTVTLSGTDETATADPAFALIDGGSGTDTFVSDPDFSFNAFNFEA